MKNENITPDKNNYWFPAKKYGWGWGFPNCWQGWVVFLVWLAGQILGTVLFATGFLGLYFYIGWEILLGAALVIIVVSKGEPPRWRWGGK